jgi:hypothetical protein
MSGEPGSLVGTTPSTSLGERMATQPASTATPSASTAATESASASSARPPRTITQRWLFAAFLLAGGAQLITIAALLGSTPLATSWSALLLAIAPAPLAAAGAFTTRRLARLAAAVAGVVIIVGIVGSLTDWSASTARTGVLFIPALAAVVVGGLRLWRAGPR